MSCKEAAGGASPHCFYPIQSLLKAIHSERKRITNKFFVICDWCVNVPQKCILFPIACACKSWSTMAQKQVHPKQLKGIESKSKIQAILLVNGCAANLWSKIIHFLLVKKLDRNTVPCNCPKQNRFLSMYTDLKGGSCRDKQKEPFTLTKSECESEALWFCRCSKWYYSTENPYESDFVFSQCTLGLKHYDWLTVHFPKIHSKHYQRLDCTSKLVSCMWILSGRARLIWTHSAARFSFKIGGIRTNSVFKYKMIKSVAK